MPVDGSVYQPFVSVVIPCFQEIRFIEAFIEDVVNQDYPKEKMEILIVDGMSNDGTREIIQKAEKQYTFLRLLDNPHSYTPYALNIGIKQAIGTIIIRLDVHASYPPDYCSSLVHWLTTTSYDNVGGIWETRPRSDNNKAKAIALMLGHPLGVGNSTFRIGTPEPKEVDTVPFGCYRKSTLEKIGLFDERLHRNQDLELNKRLSRHGGKHLLVPEIKITYYARDTFKALWKNQFANGKWHIPTLYYTKELNSVSFRHMVPLFFVIYLFLFFLIIPFFPIIILPLLLYFMLVGTSSLLISFKEQNWGLLPYLIAAFFINHISYGLGTMEGIVDVMRKRV